MDSLLKECVRVPCPGDRALERISEVGHDPCDERHVVDDNGITDVDDAETHALGALVGVMPGEDAASTVCLADGDFEDQHGDGHDRQGDQVRDEELKAWDALDKQLEEWPQLTMVIVYHGREAEEVPEADGTAHSGEDEGEA